MNRDDSSRSEPRRPRDRRRRASPASTRRSASRREAKVTLLAKGPLRSSASYLAQGGVAAALGEDDDPAVHAEDTLARGGASAGRAPSPLSRRRRRRGSPTSSTWASSSIAELGLEGGHSRRRVVHAGGAETGRRDRATSSRSACSSHPRISVVEGERVVDLWTRGRPLRRRSHGEPTRSRRARRCSPPAARRRSGSGRRTRAARSATASRWPTARAPRSPTSSSCSSTRPRSSAPASCSARRCAARARCWSTTTATASPTSWRRATSSPARSERAAPRCSTCARSTAAASRP